MLTLFIDPDSFENWISRRASSDVSSALKEFEGLLAEASRLGGLLAFARRFRAEARPTAGWMAELREGERD